jgi:serine/threonine protein phosphatase PrpC
MHYATHYDVGDRKRDGGINEDSVAVSVIEQGHRSGLTTDGIGEYGTGERDDEEDTPANRSAAVFALADGAGGHDAGDVASYLATTVICEELAPVVAEASRRDPDDFDVDIDESLLPDRRGATDLQTAVADAIVAAHRDVVRYAAESGTQAYTTVVAGLVVDGEVHYGWVGDSRAYLVNGVRESIELLTKDHGVVQELLDRGEVDDVAAHVHPRGNEITRALGGAGDGDPETASVPVETNSVPLFAEDVLLVTSDGLIDAQTDAPALYERYVEAGRSDEAAEEVRDAVVTDEEIRDLVLGSDSLDDAASGLIDLSNDRGGKDNLSVIFARDPTLPPTPGEDEGMPVRAIDPDDPVEDRETVIVPGE